MNTKQLKGSLYCILGAFIWGVAFVAQVAGMDHVGPFTFLCVRSWPAAAVLAPFALLSFKKEKAAGLLKDAAPQKILGLPGVVGAGVLCGLFLYVASAFQLCGVQYTTAGKGGFITALYVVMVPLARLFTGRKPSALLWGCVALAAAALWLLCITPGETGINKGDVLIFVCAFFFTGQIMTLDKYSPCFSSLQLSFLQFATCAVVGTPLMLFTETFSLQAVTAAAVPLLYAGVMSSGVAYTLQVMAQKITDPTVASILFCLESVFAVLADWVLLHQALSPRELAGCLVMFAAILLAQHPAAQGTPAGAK